jgi:dTDP-4-dehydrorhamnose 3,5-epimerase-like enzyme
MSIPELREYPTIGSPALGYITVGETRINVPFEIKRVYWTYYTPNDVLRGGHAHRELEQMIFAVSGRIVFTVEDRQKVKYKFELEKPHIGLYIPPFTWREIQFSHNAVLLCLASTLYRADDYIRDYDEFRKYQTTHD